PRCGDAEVHQRHGAVRLRQRQDAAGAACGGAGQTGQRRKRGGGGETEKHSPPPRNPKGLVMRAAWLSLPPIFPLAAHAAGYLPRPGDQWETRKPGQEGFDAAKLQAAIDFAVANETVLFPDLKGVIDERDQRITIPLQFAGPYSDPIGPLTPHAPA